MCSRSEDIKRCGYRILENPEGGLLASVKGVQLESPSTITSLSRPVPDYSGTCSYYCNYENEIPYLFIYLLEYGKDSMTVSRIL